MQIPEELADWRCSKVFRVRGDQTINGQFVKDGTPGWLTTWTKDKVLGQLTFPKPRPAALAFNLAFESARAAVVSRARLSFKGSLRGPKAFEQEHVPTLYAYFEQMMSTVVFSFQCIEAYANEVIANNVKGPMDISRKNGIERLSTEEL